MESHDEIGQVQLSASQTEFLSQLFNDDDLSEPARISMQEHLKALIDGGNEDQVLNFVDELISGYGHRYEEAA